VRATSSRTYGKQPQLQRLGVLNREMLAQEHFAQQRENQRKAEETVTQGAQEHAERAPVVGGLRLAPVAS
jgi:hypothetical protein